MAQEGAAYDGMMRSALATGLVDFVLPAESMAGKLTDYFRHINETGGKKEPEKIRRQEADCFPQLCTLLRARNGHDFGGYKDKTILRRMHRRMKVLQIGDVQEFIDRLSNEPRQVDLLFQDILIGMTTFFRDPGVFETLGKEIIPRLFEGNGPDDTVRVWVPACATGEEAYSIAILLRDHMP